jgi:hypothetical protein
MAPRRKLPTVPPTLPDRSTKSRKVRYGRGMAGMTEAKLRALLKAGWTPPEKRPPGRPKLEIDPKQVERLAALFHTQREIAELLGCSVDTISDRFSDAYYRGRAQVKSKLRKRQLDRATKDGSDRMLIWLGVQELGQKHRHELSGDPDAPLVFEPIVPGGPTPAPTPTPVPPGAGKEPT